MLVAEKDLVKEQTGIPSPASELSRSRMRNYHEAIEIVDRCVNGQGFVGYRRPAISTHPKSTQAREECHRRPASTYPNEAVVEVVVECDATRNRLRFQNGE